MADYLEATLRRGDVTERIAHGNMADGDTRALFVMTLGRLGRPQPQYINSLWEKRDSLSAFGLSLLAIAVDEMQGGNKALLGPILQRIRDLAEEDSESAYFTGNRDGGYSMGSPLRSHAGAVLAYATTGEDVAGVGQKFLRGLLERRTHGLWGNTQENVYGMMGVYEMAGNASASDDMSWNMQIKNRSIDPDEMEAPDPNIRRIRFSDAELEVGSETESILLRSSGSNGFLSLRLAYEIPLNALNPVPIQQGFSITRSYETMDGTQLGQTIPLGDLIRIRIKVDSPEARNYVAIYDLLPAGLEALNSSLETTESVDLGELSTEAQRALSVLSYSEIRDDRVSFHIDEMLPGEYEFVYVARATSEGEFLRPYARVEAMYDPDAYAQTDFGPIEIR